ncbi:MAG TPA: hypothetical protein VKG21_08405 [Casimicrobiaceae bacterium]|nr:hypothetical protein [Casimicrobiaceae bacterium]
MARAKHGSATVGQDLRYRQGELDELNAQFGSAASPESHPAHHQNRSARVILNE